MFSRVSKTLNSAESLFFKKKNCRSFFIACGKKTGDKVEWVYTCDLGVDVGGNYSARNGS